jgi:hypothetical protein
VIEKAFLTLMGNAGFEARKQARAAAATLVKRFGERKSPVLLQIERQSPLIYRQRRFVIPRRQPSPCMAEMANPGVKFDCREGI